MGVSSSRRALPLSQKPLKKRRRKRKCGSGKKVPKKGSWIDLKKEREILKKGGGDIHYPALSQYHTARKHPARTGEAFRVYDTDRAQKEGRKQNHIDKELSHRGLRDLLSLSTWKEPEERGLP